MKLARLRQRVLLVLGIPACMSSTLEPAPRLKRIKTTQAPPPAADPQFDRAQCSIDTIVETTCLPKREGWCEARAKRVGTTDQLHVTSEDDVADELGQFVLADDPFRCCYSRCTLLVIAPTPPRTFFGDEVRTETCIPEPAKGTTLPARPNSPCPETVQIDRGLQKFSAHRDGQCCYYIAYPKGHIRGRPARVDGESRLAHLERGDAWHAALAIDASRDAALARDWLDAARLEHASVAAFATTALHLLRFGAPPHLVAAAHRAALDEISHAQISFALAARYGEGFTPGTFELRVTDLDLRAFAIETFVDGCIGETAAALEADRAAARASDPALADIFAQIASDELRHAELAWDIVAWCIDQDPSIEDLLTG